MDEQQAVCLLKQGNAQGLAFLVRQHQLISIRTAYLIVKDRATAEDIVQEAFLRVYERIHQFDETRPFRPWFLRIVINDAVKTMDRRNRLVHFDAQDAGADGLMIDMLTDPLPGPENRAEAEELRQRIEEAIATLSPTQKAVIVMRYYLDMSEAEISQETQSPKGTVKWRLHVARKRLNQLLQQTISS